MLTHDPKLDDAAVGMALRAEPRYIGAMGSSRANSARRERLTEAGFTEDDIARIAMPIGLDLGALTPEETALSIMAEISAIRNGREGGRLVHARRAAHPRGAARGAALVTIGGAILAAGDGARFGGAKQLAELDGRALMCHAMEALLATPMVSRRAVVLGARADEIRGHLDLAEWEVVIAEDWEDGLSASLRAAVRALSDCDAVVILLADQPGVTPRSSR